MNRYQTLICGFTCVALLAVISHAHADDLSDRADLVYDLTTGELTLDGSEAAGGVITNFVLTSNGEFINTAGLSNPFAGVFFTATAFEVSASDPLTTGLGQIQLGNILAPGLDSIGLESLLTGSTYVGSLGSGQLDLDLLVVPEPASLVLLAAGALLVPSRRRGVAS